MYMPMYVLGKKPTKTKNKTSTADSTQSTPNGQISNKPTASSQSQQESKADSRAPDQGVPKYTVEVVSDKAIPPVHEVKSLIANSARTRFMECTVPMCSTGESYLANAVPSTVNSREIM